jgi:hypothetical protein
MKSKKTVTTPVLPDESDVQSMVTQLAGVTQLVGSNGVVLTPQERRQVAKLRKGGKDLLPKLTDMAARHGVQITGLSPADLQPHLDLVSRLEPLGAALSAANTLVSDTTLNAKSQAWKGLSTIYTVLSRVARDNPTLRGELQSTTEFFKEPRKKAAEKKKTVDEAVAKATSAQPSAPAAQAAAPAPSSVPTHG